MFGASANDQDAGLFRVVLEMQKTLEELRAIVRSYDERWALYEYNMHRLGHDPEELRRPLDPLARTQVRARRIKVVR